MAGSSWRSHIQAQRPESKDEREVSAKWRDLGYHEHKIAVANKDGLPDRFYACPFVQFFCEWKRKGKDAEQHQSDRHDEMRNNGCIVIVVDCAAQFWEFVRNAKAAHAASL